LSELADYAWLIGVEAAHALAELAEDDAPLHRQLDRLRKVFSVPQARLAVEQAALRRRAVAKFGQRAARMFFTDLTLQQATDRWIGHYKASHFSGERTVLDFCSGIGGDLIALGERGPVVGWERAPEVALLGEANLRAWDCDGEVRVGEVAEQTLAAEDLWHLDPDRRVDGRRSTRVEWHSPGPQVVEQWLTTAPHGALKLAPAANVPRSWQDRAELEWISRDRACRQLVVWFGKLATTPGQRRATVVSTPPVEDALPTACGFAGAAGVAPPLAKALGEYIYDTDPAVRAADLTGALAEKLELVALVTGASYLTADQRVAHPLVSCFRVLDVLPLREKPLAKHLRGLGIGRLEIKKRTVDVDPEKLRSRLNLRGDASATLLLARQGVREIAILAERCDGPVCLWEASPTATGG
jgi:hypothetical protein